MSVDRPTGLHWPWWVNAQACFLKGDLHQVCASFSCPPPRPPTPRSALRPLPGAQASICLVAGSADNWFSIHPLIEPPWLYPFPSISFIHPLMHSFIQASIKPPSSHPPVHPSNHTPSLSHFYHLIMGADWDVNTVCPSTVQEASVHTSVTGMGSVPAGLPIQLNSCLLPGRALFNRCLICSPQVHCWHC